MESVTKTAAPKPDTVSMDAVEVLKNLNKGRKAYELSVAMQELVAAIRETGKAGSLTLKIKVEPTNAEASQVFVTAEITGKMPVPDEKASLFFTTRQNALVRDNPEQLDLIEKDSK